MGGTSDCVRDIRRWARENVARAIGGQPRMDTYGPEGGGEEIAVLYLPAALVRPAAAFITAIAGQPDTDGPELLTRPDPEAN